MKSTASLASREQRKQLWVNRLNNIGDKARSLAWVAAAVFIVYYTNFFSVIWENSKVNTLFFSISLISFGIFFSMILYASFVIANVEDIEIIAPRIIPTASLFGFCCFMSSLVAFWPVWGWYTPAILFTMLMGYLMAGTFVPKGKIGSVAYLVLIMGSGLSGYYIPHGGFLH